MKNAMSALTITLMLAVTMVAQAQNNPYWNTPKTNFQVGIRIEVGHRQPQQPVCQTNGQYGQYGSYRTERPTGEMIAPSRHTIPVYHARLLQISSDQPLAADLRGAGFITDVSGTFCYAEVMVNGTPVKCITKASMINNVHRSSDGYTYVDIEMVTDPYHPYSFVGLTPYLQTEGALIPNYFASTQAVMGQILRPSSH